MPPEMKNICLYFQIHQPFFFQTFRFFDIGESKTYYDDWRIEREIQDAATNYYLPTNNYLLQLIHHYKGDLKLSFNISGTALDQFLIYAPELVTSFMQLSDTGQVEFTGSTDSHSIISLADKKNEFIQSIKLNQKRTEYYFGQKPRLFVNTDLLFNNRIAEIAAEAGYSAILTNGTNKMLQWRSSNYLYSAEDQKQTTMFFRNENISNELSSVLLNTDKTEARKQIKELLSAMTAIRTDDPITNIYLNYKALGGRNRLDKQRLLQTFVSKIIKNKSCCFGLPSKITEQYGPIAKIGTVEPVSWVEHFHADYYPGNELQKDAINQLFKLSKKAASTNDNNLKTDWKYLQSSDHFHLMDENHPDYNLNYSPQNSYKSKYEAFINYMNILEDFRLRLKAEEAKQKNMQDHHKPLPSQAKHQ
jgi:alpha-amylase